MNTTPSRQQRRQMARLARKRGPALPSLDAATDGDLTKRAYEIAAKAYGEHHLTQAHREALFYMVGRMTHLATGHAHQQLGRDRVRLAYGLNCGGGKTLSAKSWIAACHRLGKPYSVAVAANEVKALCEFRRELVEDFGVPADKIALIHTRKPNPDEGIDKPTPFDEISSRPFALVTHNMVRRGDDRLALYNDYLGRPRDLILYDESLIVSEAWTVENKDISAGVDFLRREIEFDGRDDLEVVYSYLSDTLATFLAEVDSQQAGATPQVIQVPDLTSYAADLWPDAAKELLPKKVKPADKGAVKTIKALLDAAGKEVRVVTTATRGAVWFGLRVPEDLRSVFVLDASYLIRELANLGSNLTPDRAALDPGFDYRDLQIEYFQHRHGRGFIEDEVRAKLDDRKLARTLADWINDLPGDASVNVWTFKKGDGPKSPDIPRLLEASLNHFGVDTSRVNVLTHGSARGSNAFQDASNTAFYGVLEKKDLQVGADMVGQEQNLLADLDEINRVRLSEVLYELHQEIGRSAVRRLHNGRATPSRVFLPVWHVEQVAERLGEPGAYPGATMVHRADLEPAKAERPDAKYEIVAASIMATLADQPEDVDRVSSVKLKPLVQARVGFKVTKDVWKVATSAVKGGSPYKREVPPPLPTLVGAGWKASPRGYERLNSADFRFTNSNSTG